MILVAPRVVPWSRMLKSDHLLCYTVLRFQVLLYLLPLDLLYMARVNKLYRDIILQRRFSFIWTKSFMHFRDVPECPAGMSLPALAALLFEPVCSVTVGPTSRGV